MKARFVFALIVTVVSLCIFSHNLYSQCEAKAASKCFYVAVDGIDGTDRGSIDKPYKTFAPAIARALPGDFIYARGGTYGLANTMKAYDGSTNMISIEPELTESFPESTTGYVTIKSYPGEKAVLDLSSVSGGAVYAEDVHHWKLQGFEMIGGSIHLWGGDASRGNTHDIIIDENDIHGVVQDGGTNPGLIKVNRGDTGGAYNIVISNNKLHDLSDIDSPGEWEEGKAVDTAHFGAVTTLSACNYYGIDAGCTGLIEIRGNEIYEVPNAFFFKNEMYGPIEIENNLIHHTNGLGMLQSANVHIIKNLTVGVPGGFYPVGDESFIDAGVEAISGHFAVVRNNTFIGMNGLMSILRGTGHTIEYNVFFGLNSKVPGAGWETPAFISKSQFYPDTLDPATSLLQDISSDNNCFITPYSDFQFVSRYLPESVTGGEFVIEHYTYEEAKATFGFDPNSKIIIENNESAIFNDPASLDYTLKDESICPEMGYDKDVIPSTDSTSTTDVSPTGSEEGGNTNLSVSGGCGMSDIRNVPTLNNSMLILTLLMLLTLMSFIRKNEAND